MAIAKVILNGETLMDVTSDTATANNMLSGIKATKNDGTKATGTIASKSSTDMTVSGATVTAPAGYYSANASKSVATMTLPTTTSTSATSGYTLKATLDRSTSDRYLNIAPGYNSAGGYYKINKVANGSVTAPSSISGTSATVSTGTNTLTLTKTVSVTPNVTTAGYVSSGTAGNSSVSLTANVTTKAAATITPSTSAQEIAAGTYLTGTQTISAMPSGTAGTPTASKGSVSNHAISVTPSVTNTTGYITGGTKTGTAVTVSASELVSGSETKTENGTYDVTNLASLVVNVSGGGGYVTQDQDGYIVLPSTGGGGGSPSATQHTIYFEFTDSTDATINAWYDSSFISDAIRATEPTTYGQKTVSLAQLDGVTWYEPTPIPVGVELIDFTKTTNDYVVNSSGNVVAEQWYSVSDYTEIDPSMTFSYSGCYWFYIGFYDASKNTISALNMSSDGTQRPNDTNYCDGTLTPAKIPSNAKYVRITSTYNPDSTILSLIRTA